MAKVLVVDDHPSNRDLITTLLGYGGEHRCFEAADGSEALASVRVERPDLVICDVLMPTMDGYEFVRQLRADPEIAATRVVFYTAIFMEREARNLARECGVTHVLTKPCEPQEILDTVAAVLREGGSAAPVEAADVFDRDHLRLVTDMLASKVDELEHANQRLSALTSLNLDLVSERDPDALLDKVCRGARDLVGARYAVLLIRSEGGGVPAGFATAGLAADETQRLAALPDDGGVFAQVLLTGAPRRFSNPSGDPRDCGLPAAYPSVHSAVIAPVVSAHQRYGCLALFDKLGAPAFSDEDERIVALCAAQAGRIYENGRLYLETRRGAEQLELADTRLKAQLARLQLLDQITTAIGERLDLQSIYQVAIRSVEEHLPVDFSCVCRYDALDDALTVIRVGAHSEDLAMVMALTEHSRVEVDPNGLARCLRGALVYEADLSELEVPLAQRLADAGMRSLVMAPLQSESRMFGLMLAARRASAAFSSSDCEFLRQLSAHVALATRHALPARLVLRAEHGVAVDRGRLVREAVAEMLIDLEAHGEDSVVVTRLRPSP